MSLNDDSTPTTAATPLTRRAFDAGGLATAAGAALGGALPRELAAGPPAAPAHEPGGRDDLVFATAQAAATAIARRAVSSRELTELMLARIERHEPVINAMATLTAEQALARAREADAALARGASWGALHGVPITIKDAFEMAGVRTTAGATFLSSHVPTADAAVVERLRRAGAVILGNTNVPPMLGDWQSHNELFGTSRNPYDPSRTPGGSTGGGAAALAAGLCYLTMGSDVGGSVRVPAHFCGVYGHKPTHGLVSSRGHIPPPPGVAPGKAEELSAPGPLARSAGDLELAMRLIGGPDDDEAIAYRWALPAPRQRRLADYRVGFVLDDPRCPISEDTRAPLERAIRALRDAGARVEEGWPAGMEPQRQFDTYRFLLSRIAAEPATEEQLAVLRERAAREDGSDEWIEALARVAPYHRHMRFAGARRRAQAEWREWFRTHDAFLLPTAFVAAFPHDTGPEGGQTLATPAGPRRYMDLLYWISFATMTGLPATTAPVGFTAAGLPVGIQIMGPHLEDGTPIHLAAQLGEVLGGFVPPTGYAAR